MDVFGFSETIIFDHSIEKPGLPGFFVLDKVVLRFQYLIRHKRLPPAELTLYEIIVVVEFAQRNKLYFSHDNLNN
jgi:hypothetical protein